MYSRVSTAPIHADLKVKKIGGSQCKLRKTYCFTGLSHEVDYRVYNNNLTAIERAVKERVYFVNTNNMFHEPFRPTPEQFNSYSTDFTDCLLKLAEPTTPMKASAFAQSYQGRRKTAYLNAVEKNRLYGFEKKLSFINAFIKCEKYNFTKNENPVPRIIQPRNVRYIVETGRYIKPIEKKIYNAIDQIFGDITVYKGLNAKQRGVNISATWNRYSNPVALGLDASRFDQHVSNSALQWEHGIYEAYYPGDKYFSKIMSWQRDNRCFARCPEGIVSYRTRHNRMSGDSNTSLGNVLIMCSRVHGFLKKYNIRASLVNDGDDCVLIFERDQLNIILESISDFFHLSGFKLTVEAPVYELEEIVFCQSQPVMDNDNSYIMVRDPRSAIAKDCVALKPLDNPKVMRSWLSAVGKGGLSLTKGLPVWQSFYRIFERSSQGAKPLVDPTLESGFARLSLGMNRSDCNITPQSRYSFWKAFGISPSAQLCLEKYYGDYVLDLGHLGSRFAILPLA